MSHLTFFDRIVASAERIAHHAYYPGKEQAVGQCLEDIEDLSLTGRITAAERDLIRAVLLGACPRSALHAA